MPFDSAPAEESASAEDSAPAEPLETLLAKIVGQSIDSDEKVIETGKLLCELRRRVEAGEAGPVRWMGWAMKHVGLSRSRIYELLRIGAAKYPYEELEHLRRRNMERQKRHTGTKLTGDRQRVFDWADKMKRWAKDAPDKEIAKFAAALPSDPFACRPYPIVPRAHLYICSDSRDTRQRPDQNIA
jgi:hypothetical protein